VKPCDFPPFDQTVQEMAVRLGDDDLSFAMEIVGLLLEQVPLKLRGLKEQVAVRDCEGVRRQLHDLKGALAILGIVPLQECFSQIEELLEEGWEPFRAELWRFELLMEELLGEMRRYLLATK